MRQSARSSDEKLGSTSLSVDQVAQLLYRLARDHLTREQIEAAIAETRPEVAAFTDAKRGRWAVEQSRRLSRET
jgi:hypothetical protein